MAARKPLVLNSGQPEQLQSGDTLDIAVGGTPLQPCDGRLTLTTGTPVTTADVTAAATVYFAPFKGNRVALYSGSAWEIKTFTELSLSLSSATAGKNSDIFLYDNSGTLTLSRTEWTNDTTRATALTTQDGVYVKSGATGYRYLGTIRTTATTGQCEDSVSKRYVWNYNNRVNRLLLYTETTANWTYNVATWRQLRAQSAARNDFVVGVSEDPLHISHACLVLNRGFLGIGYDTSSAAVIATYNYTESAYSTISLHYSCVPIIGLHTIYPIERAYETNSATFYGVSDSETLHRFEGHIVG